MNTQMIDLEVDYIDSRSITKKELDEISEFIRNQKQAAIVKPKSVVTARRISPLRKRVKVIA